MSKNVTISRMRERKERGTSLSKYQYGLMFSFLKFGRKPDPSELKNSSSPGNKSEGFQHPNTSSYFRFKSIVKRLKFREEDQEIVFRSNNKIVLPTNRFEEIIRRTHVSDGKKHLNIRQTIEKLSEEYTIGCRQFGISEETVRMVVRKCRQGTCADKYRQSRLKNLLLKHHQKPKAIKKKNANDANKTDYLGLKVDSTNSIASTVTSPLGVSQGQGQQVKQLPRLPVQMVRLPRGHFALQQSALPTQQGLVKVQLRLPNNAQFLKQLQTTPVDLSQKSQYGEKNLAWGSVTESESSVPNAAKMPNLVGILSKGSMICNPNVFVSRFPVSTHLSPGQGQSLPQFVLVPYNPGTVPSSTVSKAADDYGNNIMKEQQNIPDVNNNNESQAGQPSSKTSTPHKTKNQTVGTDTKLLNKAEVSVDIQDDHIMNIGENNEDETSENDTSYCTVCGINEANSIIADNGAQQEEIDYEMEIDRLMDKIYGQNFSGSEGLKNFNDTVVKRIQSMRGDLRRSLAGHAAAASTLKRKIGMLQEQFTLRRVCERHQKPENCGKFTV